MRNACDSDSCRGFGLRRRVPAMSKVLAMWVERCEQLRDGSCGGGGGVELSLAEEGPGV